MNPLPDLLDNLTARADVLIARLQRWSGAAFRVLISKLRWFAILSLGVLVVAMVISIMTQSSWIMPYAGLFYLGGIVVMLYSANTLRAVGLLMGVDVAVDVLKEVIPPKPSDALWTRLGSIVKLRLGWDRVRDFATLQLVAWFLFYALIVELLIILFLWIVPVYKHPEMIGPALFLATLIVLLSTPWGQKMSVGKLRPLLVLGLVFYILYHIWAEIAEFAVENTREDKSILGSITTPMWLGIMATVLYVVICWTIEARGEKKNVPHA